MRATNDPRAKVVTLDAAPHLSRTEWTVEILRERILKGVYSPGSRITETELQLEFGFSNGPIREALHQLVSDGLAERIPAKGVRVVQLSSKEIADLFQLRLALLEHAAELAAKRSGSILTKDVASLRKTLKTALAGVRKGDLSLMNGELTKWVLAVADNSAIAEVWNRTMLRTRVYAYEAMLRSAAKSEPVQLQLIDAIAAGSVTKARAAVRELTRQTLLDLGILSDR